MRIAAGMCVTCVLNDLNPEFRMNIYLLISFDKVFFFMAVFFFENLILSNSRTKISCSGTNV